MIRLEIELACSSIESDSLTTHATMLSESMQLYRVLLSLNINILNKRKLSRSNQGATLNFILR